MNNKKYSMIYALILMTVLFCNGCVGQVNEDAVGIIDNISANEVMYQEQADDTSNVSQNQMTNTESLQIEEAGNDITRDELENLDIPENMLAYWLVLNSKIPFISANEGCQEFFLG